MNEKIKLTANILFSGIGAQERGFRNSDLFDVKVLTTSDISKEATLSYAAIHCGLTKEMVENYTQYPSREEMAQCLTDINLGYEPEKNKCFDWFKLAKRKNKDIEKYWLATKLTNNLGDISKIKDLPYADLWTISFCCQDISVAGKMKGLKPDSGTRSSLLWDNIKLLQKAKENKTLPLYVMFENVKNLVSKKFINDFNDLIDIMDELGFNTYWKVLNGKECGIPQNRERVFVIAIRKDIDTKSFTFPKPFDNGLRLKDLLEEKVDDKYYISEDVQRRFKITDNTLTKNIIETTKPTYRTIGQRDLVYQQESVIGALVATDYKQPKQIVDTSNLRQIGQIYGTNKEPNPQAGRIYDKEYISPTLDSCSGGNRMPKISDNIRIRKLTPIECWRLMGFKDEDVTRCINVGISDTHLYKQAGNSIITNCCELLAEHLYKSQYDNTYVCYDENFTKGE